MRHGSLASARSVLLALVVGTLAAGCLIDRGALTPPRLPGADAGTADIDAPGLDAFAAPGDDAWSDLPDAPVSEDDAPVVEVDADVPCDRVGDACCGGSCASPLVCLNDGSCGTACGSAGQSCCYTGACFGTTACNSATAMCEACGGAGQVCCGVAPRCEGGLGCAGDRCAPCGEIGQPCCDTGCRAGECGDGACRATEGSRGGRCRLSAMPCDPWAVCQPDWSGGVCQGCGMSGERCCSGGGPECISGLSCRGPAWDRSCSS